MLLRRVEGNSMLPGLLPGAVVVAWGSRPGPGDVVIARQGGREVVKRVNSVHEGRYELRGDNAGESIDSREFGPVKKDDILGVVMLTLPTSIEPPKARTPYSPLAGMVAAGILAISAIIHLFRIDTFLPLLDKALPGDYVVAAGLGSVIVTLEVFAVPFMLRMKLSPLMHVVSGLLTVIVPLIWLLVAIWTYGSEVSTAQLGEFMSSRSGVPLLMLNSAWLVYNLWTLWLLNYEKAFLGLFRR